MTPITSPSFVAIGTLSSDWKRSSSSSGTYFTRGSSSRLSGMNAGRRCSTAHQASPSPRAELDLSDEVTVRVGRGSEHQPLAGVLDEVEEAGVHGARVREQPDDRTQHLVELERRGDGRDDASEKRVLAVPDGHRCLLRVWQHAPSLHDRPEAAATCGRGLERRGRSRRRRARRPSPSGADCAKSQSSIFQKSVHSMRGRRARFATTGSGSAGSAPRSPRRLHRACAGLLSELVKSCRSIGATNVMASRQ